MTGPVSAKKCASSCLEPPTNIREGGHSPNDCVTLSRKPIWMAAADAVTSKNFLDALNSEFLRSRNLEPDHNQTNPNSSERKR